ncbi:hypothetical protein EYF80_066693 [Liparis tanakae]|uniref:Uncharacterized protein n=1 Tax=Liparis tanakae TaxID=230148 RepID=A0A4Z2E392_9TELE|nr:hypothetical protein EYF80_066693 [Liparis tanakae]
MVLHQPDVGHHHIENVFTHRLDVTAQLQLLAVQQHHAHLPLHLLHLATLLWYRRGEEGVSKVQHGGAMWEQGVICGVEVGPGQPAGQVGLEPLHLLLLPLEKQLCSNEAFISCPVVQPGGGREV